MSLVIPSDPRQNLDLALQVLIASDAPLPSKVQSLTVQDLVQN